MATPLLDFLVGRAKEALPYLRGAAKQGLSAAAAIELLRPLNLTFRRQSMLDVYAALTNRIDPERTARFVGQTIPIPLELHNVSPVNLSTNYQYVVGATDETGEPIGYVTVVSNVALAPVQIRTRAGLLFASEGELYLEEGSLPVTAVSIEEANVSPSAPNL